MTQAITRAVAFTSLVTLVLPNCGLADSNKKPVTFAGDIANIVHTKCTICHRKGQPGPFELVTFEDVRDRAETIRAVVHDGYMPPWKPVNTNVEFSNDRRLTDSEQKLLGEWVENGMPAGDLSQVRRPDFSSGWSLGKPDAVLKMTGRFKVPASGPDVYRSFLFEAGFPEDKWVKAVELRPTARGAVHHGIFYIDTSGEARKRNGADGKAGFSGMSFLRAGAGSRAGGSAIGIRGLGGYVPGAMPNKLPGDLAMLLPKGGDVVMQTHFHPSGKVEWEEAELALYFADKRPSRDLAAIQLPPAFGRFAGLDVPAGEKDFEISQSFTLPVAVEAIQVGGHAHYICRDMELTATLPGGKKIDLLKIDDWDLDWQDQYQFKKPLPLPAGTKLHASLHYDNSADNPENPHSPPRRIKWGRQSTDEMGSVTLQVVAADPADHKTLAAATTGLIRTAAREGIARQVRRGGASLRGLTGNGLLVKRWDGNGDGQLQKSEVPERYRDRVFRFADRDKDGTLDETEIERVLKLLKGRR